MTSSNERLPSTSGVAERLPSTSGVAECLPSTSGVAGRLPSTSRVETIKFKLNSQHVRSPQSITRLPSSPPSPQLSTDLLPQQPPVRACKHPQTTRRHGLGLTTTADMDSDQNQLFNSRHGFINTLNDDSEFL
ncbi:unnamed protein product [Lymnaea stagnalis]|uniref:Uncharacterized protein n=1 Tax=Lymnaea stagnalis TaxID=6523 RepID=A0AAV2IFY6_LYMST